jgi:hypothetical protein
MGSGSNPLAAMKLRIGEKSKIKEPKNQRKLKGVKRQKPKSSAEGLAARALDLGF